MSAVGLPSWAEVVGGEGGVHAHEVLAADERGARVVALRTSGPDGVHVESPVVAKRYEHPGVGRTAAHAMRALHGVIATSPHAPLRVPRVVAWHEGAGVLVQSEAKGLPLLPLLGGPQAADALARVARATAYLHDLPLTCGRVVTVDDHVRDLMTPSPDRVASVWPSAGTRIERVLAGLRVAEAIRPLQPRPIHRDVHARQMFLDERTLWVVDWDLFARGDPALDVANFAIYLETHLGARGEWAAGVFLGEYERLVPGIRARLPLFTALTCVRLICKAYRLQKPGWEERAEALLCSAEQALATALRVPRPHSR